jgi:hypothetical protein
MIKAILVILRARFQISRNSLWRGSIGRKIGLTLVAVVLGFGAFALYWLMQGAVSLLTSERFRRTLERAARDLPGLPTDVRPFLDALPGTALFFALAVLLITGFTSVLSSLYLSGDLDMLLAAPIPTRAVFAAKLIEGLVAPYALLFALAGPALIGYGQGLGYQPAFYIVLPVVLVLFPLLPTSVGALLVLAVLRFVPARRAREIVSVIGGLFGAAWWIASQFSRQIATRVSGVETFESFRRLDNPLLPSAWAGRALVAAGHGDWTTLLSYGGMFVVSAVGLFALCLFVSERLYYAGWSNMATQGGRVRTAADRQRAASGESRLPLPARWLPRDAAAILVKDIRLFTRDLRNLQRLIFPLALLGFWGFQLVSGSSRAITGLPGQGTSLAPAGLAFLASVMLSNALGGTGISREGRAFWLLKLAPVSAWRILLGKLILSYLPFPLIGLPLTIGIGLLQHSDASALVRTASLLLVVGLGATSLQLGLGAAFPRFDWENPQQQTTARGGCITTIATVLYFALALGAALGLPALAELFAPNLALLANIAGWLAAAALSLGVAWAVLAFGAARLERVQL